MAHKVISLNMMYGVFQGSNVPTQDEASQGHAVNVTASLCDEYATVEIIR